MFVDKNFKNLIILVYKINYSIIEILLWRKKNENVYIEGVYNLFKNFINFLSKVKLDR